jgi:hypothetical protein
MTRLVNTNPELFENKTLGEANPTVFLDEQELQNIEDKAARFEKREPSVARREIRYPTLMPSGTVPSSVKPVINMVSMDEVANTTKEEDVPPQVSYTESVTEEDETYGLPSLQGLDDDEEAK